LEYHALLTLDDALRLKASLHNARVMANGQSLMFILNMRFALSDHLIDLNPLAELCYIRREAALPNGDCQTSTWYAKNSDHYV